MNRTDLPVAQRLSEAFDRFTTVSEQLSSSYRLLENRLRELSARQPGRAETPERLQARAARADHLERYLDAIPAGIVILDGDGKIAECNSAAVDLLGSPLLGMAWREVIDRAFAAVAELDEPMLKDGRRVALATNPVGRQPGQLILLQDVSEARALQNLLRHTQRLASMGRMAGALAHQIRTPLAASLLYISQLEHRSADSVRPLTVKIRACLEHLERLVKDMLLFARDGRNDGQTFTLSSLLEALQQLALPELETGGCRLVVTDGAVGARVRGNGDTLLAALHNLISNAVQASAGLTDAQVRLTTARLRDCVEIVVGDDGPGIPAELQAKVFEPFFTTKSQGTGLGLAVAQAVAQAHGGAVWLDSAPGRGTRVGLRLPLIDGAGAEAAACA